MVRQFLAVGREIRGMHEAAYLLAAFALLSQLLALVRDRLLAANFGATHTLDIYYAAFRIPDFLFATVASLLSLYALMPILSELGAKSEVSMIAFLRQCLVVFFAAMGLVALVLFIFTPSLVSFVAPGIAADSAARMDLILLIRVLLLQPILLGASNITAALTQLRHRFVLYAISPLLYNVGIILGIILLYPLFGISGLAWGVVLGAFLHLALQLPFFVAEPSEALPAGEFRRLFVRVLSLSIPRTLALASGQLVLLVLVGIASYLATGSIAVFMFAWNLQAVPLTIIGVSYSVAAFPTLARLHAAGEREEFLSHIATALRHIIFWTIPATILVIVLRAQLVRVILGAGLFDWNATRLVAAALALMIVSLCAQSISLLVARAYYAAGKTLLPLYFSLVGVVVSIVSAVALSAAFHEHEGFRLGIEALLRVEDLTGTTILMLALAYTLGSIMQAAVGLYHLAEDFHFPLGGFKRLVFDSFSASVIGGAVCYLTLSLVGQFVDIDTAAGILVQGTISGIAGLLGVVGVLRALKNKELAEAFAALKRRFVDSEEPALEPTDVSS